MILVAHRGRWEGGAQGDNTAVACGLARRAGFGLEIDVRARGDDLLAAHGVEDLARPADEIDFDTILFDAVTEGCPLVVVDPKDSAALVLAVESFRAVGWPESVIVRDLPEVVLPQRAHLIDRGRLIPAVWALDDAFDHPTAFWDWDGTGTDWRTSDAIATAVRGGKRPILVSDECLGRSVPVADMACRWRDAYAIITDFPCAYRKIFRWL